jgi:hypothetical protein
LDRHGAPPATAEDDRARHGFEREPDLRRAEGSAYNGHFGCTCYHPLFVFNQLGDLERCALRPGNVHSADGWREVEGMGYAIRLPANRVLQEKIGYDMSSSASIPG